MMIEATWSTNEVCVVTKADIHVVDCSPWTELVAFMTTSPIDDALTKGIKPYALCQAESGLGLPAGQSLDLISLPRGGRN